MRHARRLLVLLLALVALDQLVLFTVLRDDELFGVRVAPFAPPFFTDHQEGRVRAAKRRLAKDGETAARSFLDPHLGWCPRPNSTTAKGLYAFDVFGGRASDRPFPETSAAGVRRVVAVGCSFTRGDEVPGDQTWAAYLHDGRGDLDLANLGMGGYGLDQAQLRFVRDGLPLAPDEAWIGWVPSVTLRMTTTFPPCMGHYSGAAVFKPRYELVDGQLVLVPMPTPNLAKYVAAFDRPEELYAQLLAHDHWVQRSPLAYAPRGSSIWHRTALGRLALTRLERGDRNAHPYLLDEADPVRALTIAVLRRFAEDARAAGVVPRLLILPGQSDLAAAASGERPWQGVVDAVADLMDHCDPTDALIEAGAVDDRSAWMDGWHYAPSANRVVAEAIAATWLD